MDYAGSWPRARCASRRKASGAYHRGALARGGSRGTLRKNRSAQATTSAERRQSEPRGSRLSGHAGSPAIDPCAGRRALLLLPATNDACHTLPRPCGAARVDGQQFLPQPGLELRGMQFAERRAAGGGFSAVAVPRGAVGEQRTQGAAAGAGENGVGEDAACFSPSLRLTQPPTPAGCRTPSVEAVKKLRA